MPHPAHGVKIERQVMDAIEGHGQHLSVGIEMAQVGAAVAGADLTFTGRIRGPLILGEAGVLDIQAAFGSKQQPVTGG